MGSQGRKKSCTRKRRYESWAEADEHAAKLERQDNVPMNAYECRFCHWWHVGHTPKSVTPILYHPDINGDS